MWTNGTEPLAAALATHSNQLLLEIEVVEVQSHQLADPQARRRRAFPAWPDRAPPVACRSAPNRAVESPHRPEAVEVTVGPAWDYEDRPMGLNRPAPAAADTGRMSANWPADGPPCWRRNPDRSATPNSGEAAPGRPPRVRLLAFGLAHIAAIHAQDHVRTTVSCAADACRSTRKKVRNWVTKPSINLLLTRFGLVGRERRSTRHASFFGVCRMLPPSFRAIARRCCKPSCRIPYG